MKERDRLLQQTLSFVQGVAAQRTGTALVAETAPAPLPEPIVVAAQPETFRKIVGDPASVETDALISLIALSQATTNHEMPTQPQVAIPAVDSPSPIRVAAKPPVYQPAAKRPVEIALPERDAIALRVARFRAGQQRLQQDRDDNYAAVQARIRATLSNDPSA